MSRVFSNRTVPETKTSLPDFAQNGYDGENWSDKVCP
ncbi:MAG: Uncharacterised protein [Methanobacteriota archaeon]|nr:MAG: Uncharacterised protein [Euryarchaeota archaeon]